MIWRLFHQGFSESIGLMSDGVSGLILFLIALLFPHWLRMVLVLFWVLFQTGAWELFGAMQRFPAWQDMQYLADPSFMEKSTAGFHLTFPYFTGSLFASLAIACFFPVRRPGRGFWLKGLVLAICLLAVQGYLSGRYDNQSLAARYNPLHWFIKDAASLPFQTAPVVLSESDLPIGLRELNLRGTPLLAEKGAAKNVLIVVLEGLPGLYHPEIRQEMGVSSNEILMNKMAASTPDAMLIPDFVCHSHQTIRGLYAILCGDFSKLSYDMPKAFEIIQNPSRAQDCLPAQMAKHGWTTHYLQAANLMFMGKDRVMPAIGFQHVHGVEWFTEPNPYECPWGAIDPIFFRGARKYISQLQTGNQPWMLTLLTVGTHQPFAAPDNTVIKYGTRKDATVAILDQAMADFMDGLRQDGVLKDTLVVIVSDESHGSNMAEWMCSWDLGMVIAPEHAQLPHIKQGTFGLVDVTASVMDYLGLEIPKSLIGRSFFRDYTEPREMVAYTAGKLRWHTAGGMRYECAKDGSCRKGKANSILGDPPEELKQAPREEGARLWALAAVLDHKLASHENIQTLHFANGEIRKLPEKLVSESEWSENLSGAQYLDFPAGSKVHVSIRVKAVKAPENGIQLKLFIRQYEILTTDIPFPEFPVLHAGEEGGIEFDFENPKDRKSFSFHLVGEGKNASVQMQKFDVTIDRRKG